MNYIVAYDITSNKRRKKIADYLGSQGERINKSVFILTNCNKKKNKLMDELSHFINKGDNVFVTPLCNKCFQKGIFIKQKPSNKRSQTTIFT